MSFLKENKIYVLFIYINLLFILTLASICYKINNFNYFYVTALFFAGFLFYWFYHSALKKKILKLMLFLLLLSLAAWIYFYNREAVINFIKAGVIDKFNYINSLVAEAKETSFADYKGIFILVLPAVTWVILFLTARGLTNSILVLNLALITALWYFGYTEEIKKYLSYYIVLNLITYAVNSFRTNIKKLNKRGINVQIKAWKITIFTIIVSAAVAAITSLLPQEYSGRLAAVKESRIYNKFAKHAESSEEKAKKYKYDLAYSGYDNNKKRLGGPVTVNKLIAFRVEGEEPYYLKGSVKDYYDGFSWEQSERKYYEKGNSSKIDLMDDLYYPYLDTSSRIKIYPEELNTTTAFTPIYGFNAYLEEGNIFYDDIPTFISDEVIKKPYSIDFFKTYINEEELLDNIYNKSLAQEVDKSYYEANYKKYLQLPPNISERVYDLVYDITKDARSSFAKVKAIRDYLNKNYKYTLNTSEVPEGAEFLDYFLFTEKKGYCTYFATAETIMCRIAGIPARFVEGFNMTNERDENHLYIVRNENAHAWSEVLFIERPGSGFWYKVDAVPNAAELIHKEEEEEKLKEKVNDKKETEFNVLPSKKPLDYTEGTIEEGFSEKVISDKVLKIIYFSLTCIILITAGLIIFSRKKSKILKSKSVIPIYKYSLGRLKTIGIVVSDYIGDFEMFEKLEDDLAGRLKEAGELAYREYYGEKSPGEFDKIGYYNFIEKYVKKRQSKLEYLIKKHFFYEKISSLKVKSVLLYKRIKQSNT